MKTLTVVSASILLPLLALHTARTDEILPGQKLPELPKLCWIKGTPIERWEEGTTYVLVFTGTWGDPMNKAMPLVEKLTREFTQYDVRLRVVALALNDRNTKTATFRNLWGPEITYDIAVAGDHEADRHLWNFVRCFGVDGIPYIAVVEQTGRLAWAVGPGINQISPKMPLLALVLEDVLVAEFDPLDEPGALRRSGRRLPLRRDRGDRVQQLKTDRAAKRFAANWHELVPLLDELAEADPSHASEYAVEKFDASLLAGKPPEEIRRLGMALAQGQPDEKLLLLALAGKVVEASRKKNAYVPVATSFVRATWPRSGEPAVYSEALDGLIAKVDKLHEDRDTAVWELWAALHRAKGDLNGAYAAQMRAYFLAEDRTERARLRVELRRYREQVDGTRPASGGEPAGTTAAK